MTLLSCDIFCRVIDNFGDAGVCWRLARQLTSEFGWRIRLFIDDPALIALLAPGQQLIDVRPWGSDWTTVAAAEVVIEAFACELPATYVDAMRARTTPPAWLNLEYLSAEDWVAGYHRLPSPQQGLRKYFFFPGFVPGTGGLLREKTLAAPLLAAHPASAVSSAPTFDGPLEISLFCYDNPQLAALLAAWCESNFPIICHVADGLPRSQVETWLGEPFPTHTITQRDNLTLHALPFLPQQDYDHLLTRCHLNFVRGEDSFVRAQWAERPFVWQAYPQTEGTHLTKLDAFLNLYNDNSTVRAFFQAWNGQGPLDWRAFATNLPTLAATVPAWVEKITLPGDLASNLVKMCTEICAARL